MNAITESLNLFNQSFTQLSTRFDSGLGAMWWFMQGRPRPCYTETLLHEMHSLGNMIESTGGQIVHEGAFHQVKYAVLASSVPGVFNLGGDLAAFKALIEAQDRGRLMYYARLCIDNVWAGARHLGADVTTIALIQGQAMGGGFEAALPSDVIIAERGARIGLPEVLFNLFPGMGALSFLSRKIGMRGAEEIIYSGATYTAEELAARGVIDIVVDDGTGEKAVQDWIGRHGRSAHARRLVQRAKEHINPVTYQELIDITEVWVDGALKLSLRDLRIMDRIIAAQNRRGSAADSPRVAA